MASDPSTTVVPPKQGKYLEGRGKRILILDDQPDSVRFLTDTLKYQGFSVITSDDASKALDLVDQDAFDCILCEVELAHRKGIDVLSHAMTSNPSVPVIMISGQGTIYIAVEATKRGAFDFLEKPLNANRLLVTIRNALAQRQLMREKVEVSDDTLRRYGLIGNSPVMKNLFRQIEKVAATRSSVIIWGETGTGKELVARCLHKLGGRREGPFVAVNCAAIPKDLIESHLFGHRKGAFTGATVNYAGKFVEADGGTLFLDEIAELPLYAQAKLLRAVEQGDVEPVGGSPTRVDVRLLVATQKQLRKSIEQGEFREDLYHRLHVIELAISPLRERQEDAVLLANHFFKHFMDVCGRSDLTRISPQALRVLMSQPWPGNVRELEHIIERAVIFSEGPEIIAADIHGALEDPLAEPFSLQNDILRSDMTFEDAKELFEKNYLACVLKQHNGSVVAAAKALKIDRTSLWRKKKRHNL